MIYYNYLTPVKFLYLSLISCSDCPYLYFESDHEGYYERYECKLLDKVVCNSSEWNKFIRIPSWCELKNKE